MAQAQHPHKVSPRARIHPCDEPGTLHQKALALLEKELEKENTALHIIATQAEVPYHWLVALRRGQIKQPAANRLQWLIEKLSGRTVRV